MGKKRKKQDAFPAMEMSMSRRSMDGSMTAPARPESVSSYASSFPVVMFNTDANKYNPYPEQNTSTSSLGTFVANEVTPSTTDGTPSDTAAGQKTATLTSLQRRDSFTPNFDEINEVDMFQEASSVGGDSEAYVAEPV